MLIFETKGPNNKYQLQIHKFVENFAEKPDSFLSVVELGYFQKLTDDKRKHEYLQSRFAMKSWIAQVLPQPLNQMDFQKIGEGKPVLSGAKIDFNISHSKEHFALALSTTGQVGVDIEKIHAPMHLDKIAAKFFSPEETALIASEVNEPKKIEIFSKFWSGKEALIKAYGGGVFKNVHDVRIDSQTWKIQRLPETFGSLSLWQLDFYTQAAGYTCAVAYKDVVCS